MAEEERSVNKKKRDMKNSYFLHTPFDWALILSVVLINIFGLIMIYSASYYYGERAYGYTPDYFFKNQLRYVVIGLAGMLVLSYIRPKLYKKLGLLALILSIGLIFAVRMPGIGHASHGAARWIKIGPITLQIAEPVKLGVIVFLAAALTKFDIKNRLVLIIIAFLAFFYAGAVLLFSNNLSTAIIIFGIFFFMLMLNHPNQKLFILAIVAVLVVAFIAVIYIDKRIPYAEGESFRLTRIRAWLHPTDPLFIDEAAYQPTQALYAIASGGFFGKGLGQSLLKFTLPEPHNDYILAIVFEELGVFGVVILTYLFGYLLFRMFLIYRDLRDRFSRLLVLGVFLHIAIQMLLNYMVVLGLFPTTGVTLPFISYGGTSALFTMLEIGLVLSAQRSGVEEQVYREAREEVEAEDQYLKSLLEKRKRERSRRRSSGRRTR